MVRRWPDCQTLWILKGSAGALSLLPKEVHAGLVSPHNSRRTSEKSANLVGQGSDLPPLHTHSPSLQWALRDLLRPQTAPWALVKFQARPGPQGPTVLGEAGLPAWASAPLLEERLGERGSRVEGWETPLRGQPVALLFNSLEFFFLVFLFLCLVFPDFSS